MTVLTVITTIAIDLTHSDVFRSKMQPGTYNRPPFTAAPVSLYDMSLSLRSTAPRNNLPPECHHGDFEADSLALVASLTLEDLEDVRTSRKGKARSNIPLSDEEFAFQLYAEEANNLLAYSQDSAYAQSIDNALGTDRILLRDYMTLEIQAARDRDVALALNEGRAPPPDALPATNSSSGPLALLMDVMSLEYVLTSRVSTCY